MSEKLLVADDSPTIQKVVGITLANTDYDLVQAQSEEEMMSLLESDDFDLILLDFNLSEDNDGYELCSKVRAIKNNSKIMVMLGTFDNVADDRLEELGVVEKVIKPFESSKFIQKIKDAIASELPSADVTSEFDLSQETYDLGDGGSADDSEEDDNDWTISGPGGDNSASEDTDNEPMPEGNFLEADSSSSNNELASEVQGWGMSVPGVIDGADSKDSLFPPKMDDDSGNPSEDLMGASDENVTGEWDATSLLEEADDSDEDQMPSDNDLDYPDLGASEESSGPGPSSSLVSLDELSGADDEDEDIDDTDPQIIIAQQEDDPALEKEIDGELEPDEFWAADDSYEISQEEEQDSIKIEALEDDSSEDVLIEQHTPVEIGPKMEEDESHNPTVEALNELSSREQELKEVGPKLEQVSSGVSKEEIIAGLKEELRPLIKDMVKEVIEEMGKETSEKVAWEIIPDLAENLIRAEVERLSQKVQEKHSLS